MNESIFQDSSDFYNLLYENKDYAKEADYIHKLIQQGSPNASRVLDLGCGTGNHALFLAENGYEVHGIDQSARMVNIAKSRAQAPNSPTFEIGDIRNYSSNKRYDVITSLFHVVSYMTSDIDLDRCLKTIEKHLTPNGIFIFDFWNSTGLLRCPPTSRSKDMKNESYEINRKSTPTLNLHNNTVKVHFNYIVKETKSNTLNEYTEDHNIRYYFERELANSLTKAGLTPISFLSWLSTDEPIKLDDWYGLVIGRRS